MKISERERERTFEIESEVESGGARGSHEGVLGLEVSECGEAANERVGDRLLEEAEYRELRDLHRLSRRGQLLRQSDVRVLLGQPATFTHFHLFLHFSISALH